MAKIEASCRDAVKVALAPVLEVPESNGANFLCIFDALTKEENSFDFLVSSLKKLIKPLALSKEERRNLQDQIRISTSLEEILS